VLSLPLFPEITQEQQARVVDALERALEKALL
jgi:dTDP-4-amino-4,6-dideoxygalactose transaminase